MSVPPAGVFAVILSANGTAVTPGHGPVQQPPVLATAAATHFSRAFISAIAPDTDFVATAAVLYTVKRPRTYCAFALGGIPRHRPVLLLSDACMVVYRATAVYHTDY